MKAVIHIDLEEDNMDVTIRDYLLSKLKKPDENQQTFYSCNKCNKKVAKVVADFCLNNADRFKGKVYCRDCQGGY